MAKNEVVNTPVEDNEEYVSLNRMMQFETQGDTVSGQYMGSVVINQEEGDSFRQHIILSADGLTRFNESSQLQTLEKIPVGCYVKITYTGKLNRMKMFDIRMRKQDFTAFIERTKIVAANAPALKEATTAVDPFAEGR